MDDQEVLVLCRNVKVASCARVMAVLLAAIASLLALPRAVAAHCDRLDGPIVKDARTALGAARVDPVLKWIPAEREDEVRAAFQQSLSVRALGSPARELADRYFFETLVRIHREGEGLPYTGLKSSDTPLEPGIAAADLALDTGALDPLLRAVRRRIEEGLRARFARALEVRAHAAESTDLGRAYVAAYAEFLHYAEALYGDASGEAAHDHQPPAGAAPRH
jgi:hypothetical protein